jgi:hypothetical protein
MLMVYKRPLNATSGGFLPVNADQQVVRELPEDRIMVPLTQLDGRYTVLVTQAKPVGGSKCFHDLHGRNADQRDK